MKFIKNPLDMLTNQINLNIVTAVKAKIDNDWKGEKIVSPFSRLYYVKSGSGIVIGEEETVHLKPGFIYLIPVGKRISFKPDGKMEKIFIHFNITKPDGYDMLKDFKKIGIIEADNAYIQQIYRLFDSTFISDKFLFEAHIKSDVAKIIEEYGITLREFSQYSPHVKKAMELIQKRPSISLNITEISKKLYVSESFLTKQFKKETGMTVGEYIDQMVFYYAQIMLIESDKTIEEISRYYGFCDRFYFSKRFKQLFTNTPAEYRKRLKFKAD